MIVMLSMAAVLAAGEARPFEVPSADGYVIHGQADAAGNAARGAVVMVAGTGAFDRDVRMGRSGTERDLLFADLAGRFAARGLTAVRFDRRGVRYGVPAAEMIERGAAPSVTAENLSADVGAVYDWARAADGLGARCVVFFAHSEGSVHLAGVAESDRPAPALIIGMGAAMESKVSAVRWQISGRDAQSLEMMDADGDGAVTNAEVRANWMQTPSAVFGLLEPFLQPDGAWSPEDLALLRANQAAIYEQQKTAALAQPDEGPYPSALTPVFSFGWWKSWFTDERPVAGRYAGWNAPMILHYGTLDSQVREDRQRAAIEAAPPGGPVTFVTHEGRGHSLGEEPLMGPVDAAIADRIADEAAAACP